MSAEADSSILPGLTSQPHTRAHTHSLCCTCSPPDRLSSVSTRLMKSVFVIGSHSKTGACEHLNIPERKHIFGRIIDHLLKEHPTTR